MVRSVHCHVGLRIEARFFYMSAFNGLALMESVKDVKNGYQPPYEGVLKRGTLQVCPNSQCLVETNAPRGSGMLRNTHDFWSVFRDNHDWNRDGENPHR